MDFECLERDTDGIDGRYRLILDSLFQAIIVVGEDCVIRYVNPAAVEMFEWSRDELLGSNFKTLVAEPERYDHDGFLADYIKTGDANINSVEYEVMAVRKPGTTFPVDLTITEFKNENSRMFVGTIVDATLKKGVDAIKANYTRELEEAIDAQNWAEERLAQRAVELERSNEDLETFAYVASHDLRAPLRGIKVTAGWIAEDMAGKLDAESKENLNLLQSRAERLDLLLSSLLEYARVTTKRYDPNEVDVAELLADIVMLINPPETMKIQVLGEMPRLWTVGVHLQQVLQNLIENAIKHHDQSSGLITVSAKDEGDMVEFVVEDDGPGILQEFHDKVVQIFQTLQRRDEQEASGMGLALVKKIIERHGGTITIGNPDGETGRGCAMRFTWAKERSIDGK